MICEIKQKIKTTRQIQKESKNFFRLSKTQGVIIPFKGARKKTKKAGFLKDDEGKYITFHLNFILASRENAKKSSKNQKKKETLYEGKSIQSGREAYVFRKGEKKIYLSRSFLRKKTGEGDIHYFRDRKILAKGYSRGSYHLYISAISYRECHHSTHQKQRKLAASISFSRRKEITSGLDSIFSE